MPPPRSQLGVLAVLLAVAAGGVSADDADADCLGLGYTHTTALFSDRPSLYPVPSRLVRVGYYVVRYCRLTNVSPSPAQVHRAQPVLGLRLAAGLHQERRCDTTGCYRVKLAGHNTSQLTAASLL